MSAESVTYDVLRLDPAVAAYVGTDAPRIFPDIAPQEFDWPIIVYARGSTAPVFTIHGPVAATDITINVTCWATTRPEAEAICDAARNAMAGAGFVFVDRRAGFDADTEGYAAAIDFIVSE